MKFSALVSYRDALLSCDENLDFSHLAFQERIKLPPPSNFPRKYQESYRKYIS